MDLFYYGNFMLQGGAEAALGSYRYIVFKFLGQFQSFPLSSTIAH